MRWLLLLVGLLLALLAASGVAEARMHHPWRGHRITGQGSPLDGFTAPSGAYSFRKLRSAYAGPAVRIRRASDNGELDIGFLGCTGFTGCPWDEAAAAAHCAATPCFITTLYNQMQAAARNLTQATPANQPELLFNCQGNLPCLRTTTGSQSMATSATFTPTTGVLSGTWVGARPAGTSNCLLRTNGTNSMVLGTGSGGHTVATSGGSIAVAANTGWHALVGIVNAASSNLYIDNTPTAGTVGFVVTAGVTNWLSAAATTCHLGEMVFWDATVLSAGEIAVLTANQRGFWGF